MNDLTGILEDASLVVEVTITETGQKGDKGDMPDISNLVVKTTPQATGLTWKNLEDMARQLGLLE